MDVTTMPSITSLLPQLTTDFPSVGFRAGHEFNWSHDDQFVYVIADESSEPGLAQLFHELSHSLLGHSDYSRDINLLKMERDAWEKARDVAKEYGVAVYDEVVQNHLDTYREWLHSRSTCPDCTATGMQTGPKTYHCIA